MKKEWELGELNRQTQEKESWRINPDILHNNVIVISNPCVFSVTGCKICEKGKSPIKPCF